MKTAFKFARSEDIDALWQQITRQGIDVENADSKRLSTNDTEPSNGLDHAIQSEHRPKKNEDSTKTQPPHLGIQSNDDPYARRKIQWLI